ncbi:hypothetical protein FHX44_11659 [Pseudonocardia hierapolitana]|uniref:WXG100 family type VII secretion target n=1 Tax=Pseudonocardia hierapolitana TaxID=1128676 RepID=A0A561SIS7_9PSEU|nr:hypothetical protein [Pseudonocardia hierapolitana]TWF74777.1 hypothetical protein FHX44_11659 [Pseudonocardia hierapolitana]
MPEQLRLEPQAIPTVRAAVEEGLAELGTQLVRLRQQAIIPQPWMGDLTSEFVRNEYQQRVIEAVDGPLAAIRGFEAELTRILDSLKAMEDHYRRTEGNNTALWGRKA